MGSRITDFVRVTISRESAKLTRAGFGTPLIIGTVSAWNNRVKTFSVPDDLLDAGMTTSDPIYKAAVKLYSQSIKPEQFKVGRIDLVKVNEIQKVTFSDDAADGTFTITVDNGTGKTTGDLDYDISVEDLEYALKALANVSDCTVTLNTGATKPTDAEGFSVEFIGEDGGKKIGVEVTSSLLDDSEPTPQAITATVTETQEGETTGDETFAEAYAACKEADPDFYGVAIMSTTASDIQGVAQAVEADTKLFYYRTKDVNDLISGQGIGATLKASGYNRSFGVYSTDGYAEMAAMAIELTRDPGSYTLKFQQVSGVTVEDLTGSNITALKANNLNFVEAVSGYNIITSEAVVASGEFVDNIRFTDWLQVRMTEDVFQALINAGETAGKLPYTREGYAVLEAAIRKRLALGVAIGGIEEGTIEVNMPDPDDADPADKAARTVRLTKVFTAQLTGAVHKTIITGDLVI